MRRAFSGIYGLIHLLSVAQVRGYRCPQANTTSRLLPPLGAEKGGI